MLLSQDSRLASVLSPLVVPDGPFSTKAFAKLSFAGWALAATAARPKTTANTGRSHQLAPKPRSGIKLASIFRIVFTRFLHSFRTAPPCELPDLMLKIALPHFNRGN